MKKLRNEKPELSKKSPFYITKYRYYELKNFCLQYPDWKKALEQVNGWESSSHEVSGIIRGSLPESSTERQAMIRAYYSMHIDMVSGLLTPASLTDIYVMIARRHEIPPQKVESSIRSAICEINKEMGMHFTPMTYIHIVALGEKYRKKMMKAK